MAMSAIWAAFLPTGRLSKGGYGLTVLFTVTAFLIVVLMRGAWPLIVAPPLAVWVLTCANARRLRDIGASQWLHAVPVGLWTLAAALPLVSLRWPALQPAEDADYGAAFGALMLFVYTGGAAALLCGLFMLVIGLREPLLSRAAGEEGEPRRSESRR